MAAFDVYVNCSTYEGVSLTILEAMAAALPVVATPVGGNPEVVIDHETGLLVPRPRARRWPTAMLALAVDPRRRRAMGEAGRWRVKRHFSIERMVEQYAGSTWVRRPRLRASERRAAACGQRRDPSRCCSASPTLNRIATQRIRRCDRPASADHAEARRDVRDVAAEGASRSVDDRAGAPTRCASNVRLAPSRRSRRIRIRRGGR